ncbi:serine hydrolase domain-containing protein [Deinococcus radiopugnans]|uniref:CubicO group peptidase (Beta-lactamase class C family) n=2 Tax=Deinococcus radiopugnans TaxID=57497 RepID=A0A5C4Y8D2_9DEIO|nr:serine hydrolase [Deinococcus radiopugnans]MBB6016909.1 CubicO group peptidase (beta-lactamase class C family) [Deinococcus radiopugnans ATCC 19172]TNM71819.1 serine hydrolase [Deinococcus radiopugnans ATCC 19172]
MPIPQARLDALVQEARDTHSSALIVMQDGRVLIDEILDGGRDRPIETMSVTKAVLSLLVGRAVTLGHLPGADVPISDLYPEWKQGRKRGVTLRHLMTHTSGLQNMPGTMPEIYPSPDFVQLALCAELEQAPGTHFAYNNKAANLICGVLEQATGQKADDFARAELFGPLGIENWSWVRDRAGNPHGMAGLSLRPRDLARLGQLALDGGEVDGAPLISRGWIEESTRPATPLDNEMGLLWWMLFAWRRYTITETQVRNVAELGGTPQQLTALRQCLCEQVDRAGLSNLMRMAGLVAPELPIAPGWEWLIEEHGPSVGFRHDGHLGQFLVIHRDAGLVAVRMIAWDHPAARDEASGFPGFDNHVLSLLAP